MLRCCARCFSRARRVVARVAAGRAARRPGQVCGLPSPPRGNDPHLNLPRHFALVLPESSSPHPPLPSGSAAFFPPPRPQRLQGCFPVVSYTSWTRRADNDNEDEQQRATLAVLRGEERGFQRICSRVVLSTTTRGIPVCAHSETQGEAGSLTSGSMHVHQPDAVTCPAWLAWAN